MPVLMGVSYKRSVQKALSLASLLPPPPDVLHLQPSLGPGSTQQGRQRSTGASFMTSTRHLPTRLVHPRCQLELAVGLPPHRRSVCITLWIEMRQGHSLTMTPVTTLLVRWSGAGLALLAHFGIIRLCANAKSAKDQGADGEVNFCPI